MSEYMKIEQTVGTCKIKDMSNDVENVKREPTKYCLWKNKKKKKQFHLNYYNE